MTAREVQSIRDPGLYNDANGLYLNVTKKRTKSWAFRFKSPVENKKREMGLGSYPAVGLADARQKAVEASKYVSSGLDPIHERGRLKEYLILKAKATLPLRQQRMLYGITKNHLGKIKSIPHSGFRH